MIINGQEITNISNDSREIKKNGLFFAIDGNNYDAHEYINQAIENGAVVIYHTKPINQEIANITYIKSNDIEYDFNHKSAMLYNNPVKTMEIIGVTGTNGKSTTAWIVNDLISKKEKSGYIGTIGIKYDQEFISSPYTTLLPNQYNQIFAKMQEKNISSCSIEVSSHGLEQRRIDFLDVDYAIMTNLTHEHLDYHKTMDAYLEAKKKLFTKVKSTGKIILNSDDQISFSQLKEINPSQTITYGVNNQSDVMAKNIILESNQTIFDLCYKGQEIKITTNLKALFNLYNLLGAIAVVLDKGYSLVEIQKYSINIEQVIGRMEVVENNHGLNIIVDYAHTPDGFEKVFEYIEKINQGNIISVFGSAGDRDVTKRPILGQIADKYSHHIILTEEDQAYEDPQEIARQVSLGIKSTNFEYIEDRVKAIERAYKSAKKGDTIVLLAKGDDKYLMRGNKKDQYVGDLTIIKELIK